MNNLAILYADMGRADEAESLYRATLDARRRVLSPTHPETLATMNNMAVLFENQNRWEEAESLYREVLTAKKEVLGSNHRDTESTMLSLASLYLALNRIDEARVVFQSVLDQTIERSQTDGPSHRRAQKGLERIQEMERK